MLKISEDQFKFNNKNPIALIYGVNSFAGINLIESLLAQNLNLIGLDYSESIYLKKTKKPDKNYYHLQGDLKNGIDAQIKNLDYVFVCDTPEVINNQSYPSPNLLISNSINIYHLLELAKKYKSKTLLISSLDVYSGVLSSLSLKNYFGISQRDTIKSSQHESKRYAEALLTEYYNNYNLDSRIVRVADIYGPGMNLDADSEIASLFREAIYTDQLTIHGDGLNILHPTYITDVIAGISKAMFLKETTGKIYNLVNKDEINILNIAYTLQKNSTKPLKIQFTQDFPDTKFPLHKVELQQTQEDLNWRATTSFNEGSTLTLEHYFLNTKPTHKKADSEINQIYKDPDLRYDMTQQKQETKLVVDPPQNNVSHNTLSDYLNSEPQKIENNKKIKTKPHISMTIVNLILVTVSFFVVLTMFVFPIISLLLTTNGVINHTQQAISAANEKSVSRLSQQTTAALKDVYLSNEQFNNLEWFFNLIQRRNQFEGTRSLISSFEKLNQALVSEQKSSEALNKIIVEVLSGESSYQETASLKQLQNNTLLLFQKSNIELSTAESTFFDNTQNIRNKTIADKINQLLPQFQKQSLITQNLFDFLAPKNQKKYLLVFQDSTKPDFTGGKIHGYAEVKVNNKGLSEIKFFPYTGKTDTTAQFDEMVSVAVFGNSKTPSVQYDAMFITNTNLLKSLIESFNSVTLPDYAENITAVKLQERLTNQTASPQFLTSLWQETFNALKASSFQTLQKLVPVLKNAIYEKNILNIKQDQQGKLSFPNCNINNALKFNFTDPQTLQVDQQNTLCFEISQKFLSSQLPSEVSHNAVLKINKQATSSAAKLDINLKNNSQTTLFEEFQVSAPANTQLSDLQISYPISFDKIKMDRSAQSSIFSFPVEVPANADRTIEITMKLTDNPLTEYIYFSSPYAVDYDSLAILYDQNQKIIKSETSTSELLLDLLSEPQ